MVKRALMVLSIVSASPLFADDSTQPTDSYHSPLSLSTELEASYLYNSNLNIDALDRSSGSRDSAMRTRAAVNADWRSTGSVGINGGYSVLSDNYREVDAFDTLTQLANIGVSIKRGGVIGGFSYHYADVRLDGDHFLELQRPALYVGILMSAQWYWRVDWVGQNKDFDQLDAYDADHRSVGGTIYHFYRTDSFISLGATTEKEDAVDTTLDYSGWATHLVWRHSLRGFDRSTSVNLSWQHAKRDYRSHSSTTEMPVGTPLGGLIGSTSVTTVTSTQRLDRSDIYTVSADTLLTDVLHVTCSVQYSDNRSNLDSADYDQWLSTVGVKLVF